MKYDLIALDMDGTLCNDEKEIPQENIDAIIEMQKMGKTVAVVTGRPESGILPFIQELRLKDFGGYVVSYNGGRIYSVKKDKILYNCPFPKEYLKEIFDIVGDSSITVTSPLDKKIVEVLKNKGYTLVMATNPFFPRVATERRVKWAGLNKDDFKVITTYETSKYCKPNPKYFAETCEMAGCLPEETLMVGNDVDEDMSSGKIGMETYLVTDDLINRNNADISSYKKGTLKDFYEFCCEFPSLKG